ncbi:MAG: hemerythrin domain-containing protein [Tissierellia bacterium]|nr:hemerythrin domain-containing protein [Tissierellia bacterium]
MDNVQVMVNEHDYNRLMFDGWEKIIRANYEGKKEIDLQLYRDAVDFIKNFTDGLHHHKEELYLFDYMKKYTGSRGEKMVEGMLREHQIGRQMIKQILEAIDAYEKEKNQMNEFDLLANSLAYIFYLRKHMVKEDVGVFEFAKENMPKDKFQEVEEKARAWDQDEENIKTREYYQAFAEKLNQ